MRAKISLFQCRTVEQAANRIEYAGSGKTMIGSYAKEQLPERLLPPAAMAALSEGDMVEALGITSDELEVDLMEARTLVDDYVRRNPAIRTQMDRGRTIWRSDWIISLVLVVVLWWAAVYVLG